MKVSKTFSRTIGVAYQSFVFGTTIETDMHVANNEELEAKSKKLFEKVKASTLQDIADSKEHMEQALKETQAMRSKNAN
jgi:hypothetical protein